MASMEGGSQAVDPIFWRREHLSAPVIVNISWSGQEDATDGVAKRSNEHCLVLRSLTRVAEDATGEDPPPRRGCAIGLGGINVRHGSICWGPENRPRSHPLQASWLQ